MKYTVYGNEEFDRKIDADMRTVANEVAKVIPEKDLAALILGGGYGRGEGGVCISSEGMSLYNDYDMFVISKKLSRKQKAQYGRILAEVSERLSEQIGIDVDFSPLKNQSELAAMPITMMWEELRNGHMVIMGDENVLASLHAHDINYLPLESAIQLMLNRGVGLLLAKQHLSKENPDREDLKFIERNIHKAVMACGDAYMIAGHRFNSSYVKRMELFECFSEDKLVVDTNLRVLYKASILYKLKPEMNLDIEHLRSFHREVTDIFEKYYLFIFTRYTGVEINDFSEKLFHAILNVRDHCCLFGRIKNLVLNVKEVGLANICFRLMFRYPRLRLYAALPGMLLDAKESYIYRCLGIKNNSSRQALEDKFIKLWQRFN